MERNLAADTAGTHRWVQIPSVTAAEAKDLLETVLSVGFGAQWNDYAKLHITVPLHLEPHYYG
jgi:hypothetical protein